MKNLFKTFEEIIIGVRNTDTVVEQQTLEAGANKGAIKLALAKGSFDSFVVSTKRERILIDSPNGYQYVAEYNHETGLVKAVVVSYKKSNILQSYRKRTRLLF